MPVASAPTRTRPARTDVAIALLTFLVIALFVFLSIYSQTPPRAVASDAPLTDFSSARAMEHLRVIAQKPHPNSSPEAQEVRDYIVKELLALGLSPEVQTATVGNSVVSNVVGRLNGTGNAKSILLVAHYDSVRAGPGANDDGAAVSAILETARALTAGQPLKSDVIFLFTDGEERGLLGAKAFVAGHPLAKDKGLVLNFDARGNSGPVLMFQTSYQNGWLVKQFAEAAPHPFANSLMQDIYKVLPNDTDFTVFRNDGFDGLNFAFINGYPFYHSQFDTVDNVVERSLQHQGSYCLSLARHFGNQSLDQIRERDATYFDVLGLTLFHYSGIWTIPLTIIVTLAFAGVMALGFRRKQLTWRGVGLGFLALLLSMIGAAVLVMGIRKVMTMSGGGSALSPQENAHRITFYMMSFAALAFAVTAFVYVWFSKRASVQSLAVGGLLWWLILTLASTLYLPGGSYLFAWPLAFSLAGLAITFTLKDQQASSSKRFIALSLFALPGIILFTPMIYLIFVGLTLQMSAVAMVMVVLLLGLLVPHLGLMGAPNKWLPPVISSIVGLGLIVFALF
jgi:hypothetical protein